jgi:hypothetical protein
MGVGVLPHSCNLLPRLSKVVDSATPEQVLLVEMREEKRNKRAMAAMASESKKIRDLKRFGL